MEGRADAVDQRVQDLIAEGGGQVRMTTLKNSLTYHGRVVLPVVLASGRYDVSDEPGGIIVRLRETT